MTDAGKIKNYLSFSFLQKFRGEPLDLSALGPIDHFSCKLHKDHVRLDAGSFYVKFSQLSSGLLGYFLECRQEPVSSTLKGFDVTRSFSGIAESLPQFAERGVQAVVKIDKRVCWPQPLPQAFAADQSARLLQQASQNFKWFALQMNSSAVLVQFACFQTNLERTKSILRQISMLKGHDLRHPAVGSSVYNPSNPDLRLA